MATPTLTLLGTGGLTDGVLTTADASTGWVDLTTADTDIKVEGTAAMSGILRADGEQGYYDAGAAPVTAVGKTVRGWILSNSIAYMGLHAVDGYKLLMHDGTNTELKTIFGSDTYPGGWFNYIWNCDDFTTLTLANVRRWGVEAGHATNAKNVVNTWMDVIRYLDGYIVAGGTAADKVRLTDIAALDKVSAYGVITEANSVFFSTGKIELSGSVVGSVHFEMDGQILVFTSQSVAEGLYSLSAAGSGSNVVIQNSVIRAQSTTSPATRFLFNFQSNTLSSFYCVDNLIVGASTCSFKSGSTVTGNTFDNCGQIFASGSNLLNCVVKNYNGPVATGALVWDVADDPAGNLDGIVFTRGTAENHAIEFRSNVPSSMSLYDITYNNYGPSGSASASLLNNAGKDLYINVVGGDTPTALSLGGFETRIVVGLTNVTLTGMVSASEVRVYDSSTGAEVGGTENVGPTGEFTFSYTAGEVVYIVVHALLYEYILIEDYTVPVSDSSIPIQQVFDRNYQNPA